MEKPDEDEQTHQLERRLASEARGRIAWRLKEIIRLVDEIGRDWPDATADLQPAADTAERLRDQLFSL